LTPKTSADIVPSQRFAALRKKIESFFMLFRGIVTITGFAATVAVCTGYVLSSSASVKPLPGIEGEGLALAPLSLGNPSAVPGLETSSPEISPLVVPARPPQRVEHAVEVGRGDTLAKVLGRAGINGREARDAIRAFSKVHSPRRIRQGDVVRIAYQPHHMEAADLEATPGTFAGFDYNVSHEREVKVLREDGSFISQTRERPISRQAVRAEGTITSSLYMAGIKKGLPDGTLAELIRAFSWDVDFQRDIRKNDAFQVMYNRVSDETGKLVRGNEILFASLTLSGQRKAIYRFKGDDGHVEYFDAQGRSAQKALMRTPIDGARLSSGYGRRRHPVLGYTKMHRGVDFAAARGTPIYAAGNGTIDYAGRKGSYGNYIRIRHNGNYQTAYAHMKGLARGMRKGRRVSQGQVIGYVGTTGRSTGPHLHYEILRKGKQLNPMRVRMPSGRKLAGKELARFTGLQAALDQRYAMLPSSPMATASR
jgi:murein DD-endopeptidase MepM/ murein hydrolase activator NlpD